MNLPDLSAFADVMHEIERVAFASQESHKKRSSYERRDVVYVGCTTATTGLEYRFLRFAANWLTGPVGPAIGQVGRRIVAIPDVHHYTVLLFFYFNFYVFVS